MQRVIKWFSGVGLVAAAVVTALLTGANAGDAIYAKRTTEAFALSAEESTCVGQNIKKVAPWAKKEDYLTVRFSFDKKQRTCISVDVVQSELITDYVRRPDKGAKFSPDGTTALSIQPIGKKCVNQKKLEKLVDCFSGRGVDSSMPVVSWSLSRESTDVNALVQADELWQLVSAPPQQYAVDVNTGVGRRHVGYVQD